MRFFILLAVSYFLSGSRMCFAQQSTSEPIRLDIFPPSPNAAAFQKFGDVPISLSSGIPQIGVPIHSFNSNSGLKLDISLSYHAGGVKVEEIASDVGLSWALSAGGMVTRTVRGVPDDFGGVGYFYRKPLRHAGQYVTEYCKPFNCSDELPFSDSVLYFHSNNFDSQSDIFSYSFNGKSGKIVYGVDGSYVSIPHSQVKVERILMSGVSSGPTLLGFIITDTDGVSYHFNDSELIQVQRVGDALPSYQYSSTWYLSKIVAPFKEDSILFEYEPYNLQYQQGHYEVRYVNSATNTHDVSRDLKGTNQFSGTLLRIRKIKLPEGTEVLFNYSPVARKDISGGSRLEEVRVSKGSTYFGYKLWHSYHSSFGTIPYAPESSPLTQLRLQLDSVSKFSGDLFEKPYKFKYILGLPDRLDKAQDYWGYYTGRSSNTLIPAYYDIYGDKVGGADRRPHPEMVKNGSLYEITYPTGGTTTFDFEVNRAGDNSLIQPIVETHQVPSDASAFKNNHYEVFNVTRSNPNQPIKFNFNMGLWCPEVTNGCFFTYSVKSLDGGVVYAATHFTLEEAGQTKSIEVNNFPNGSYQLTYALSHSQCVCEEMFDFFLSWNDIVLDTNQFAGGIRVKRITDHDGIDHTKDIIKEYEYIFDNGVSSGKVRCVPQFKFSYYEPCPFEIIYTVHNSAANVPWSNIGGASVTYGQVVVKQKSPEGYQGKTVHRFRDFSDVSPAYSNGSTGGGPLNLGLCLTVEPDINWGIGMPTGITYYNKNNVVVKKEQYIYNYVEQSYDDVANFRSFKIGIHESYAPICLGELGADAYFRFSWREYYPITGRTEKIREIISEYMSSGDSIVNEINYTYDPQYYNLKTVSRLNSKEETEQQRLYYPYDFQVGGAIQKLCNRNILNLPIAIETWLLNESSKQIVSSEATDYQELPNGIVRPLKLYRLNANCPVPESSIGVFNPSAVNRNPAYFKEEIDYNAFDSKGNILQYTQREMPRVILWDYTRHLAIASVINASIEEVAYTSFESYEKGGWIFTPRVELNSSATGYHAHDISNAPIQRAGLMPSKKYVLSFWKKNATINLSVQPISGTALSYENTETGWTYWQGIVTGISDLMLSGEGLIDELRLYPVSAQMTTYTYDSMGNVSFTCGPDNRITSFQYDGLNRLQLVKDQDGNMVKYFEYNFRK